MHRFIDSRYYNNHDMFTLFGSLSRSTIEASIRTVAIASDQYNLTPSFNHLSFDAHSFIMLNCTFRCHLFRSSSWKNTVTI